MGVREYSTIGAYEHICGMQIQLGMYSTVYRGSQSLSVITQNDDSCIHNLLSVVNSVRRCSTRARVCVRMYMCVCVCVCVCVCQSIQIFVSHSSTVKTDGSIPMKIGDQVPNKLRVCTFEFRC